MALYILGNKQYSFYKIGISNTPYKRKKNIQTNCPFEIKLFLTIETNNKISDKELERLIHNKLAEFNTCGEWFKLPEGGLKLIAEYLKPYSKYKVLLDIDMDKMIEFIIKHISSHPDIKFTKTAIRNLFTGSAAIYKEHLEQALDIITTGIDLHDPYFKNIIYTTLGNNTWYLAN